MTEAPPLPALTIGRGDALLSRVLGVRLAIVGDVMLDHFLIGTVTRISPEAPVPVVALEREFSVPGGAANVALNARALGAEVSLVGVVGGDGPAADLRGLLDARAVSAQHLVTDASRPTTRKTRVATTRHQQVARIDVEQTADVTDGIESAVVAALTPALADAGAVIVSDYLKGVITPKVMAAVVRASRDRGVPVLVDPKVPHLPLYAGATLVTPNHGEAEAGVRRRIRTAADAASAARELRDALQVDGVLITLGEHGVWLSHGAVEGHLPAAAREVADVTGAGDTVVATLAAALAAGASVVEAAHLAMASAGIVVTRFGTAVATLEELRARVG